MEQPNTKIWETIQAMNQCWTCGDLNELDKLNNYFHDTMVAITPTDKNRRQGKKACVQGWQSFAENVRIHSWKETDPEIQVYGNTAVVTYYFDMSFEMGGQTINMGGRDMITAIFENGEWWIVADQFSPYPQE